MRAYKSFDNFNQFDFGITFDNIIFFHKEAKQKFWMYIISDLKFIGT